MKIRMTAPCGAMPVAAGVVFSGTPVAVAQIVELTYSNFFPPTHIQSKLAAVWCQEVEKRNGGLTRS